ncbi:myeloid-associated differentiation marker homolog [Trichomycterus rosablanca]|uniref:myeloid-associated differentiation marker homolog n=1 Tax=Trichomycterus rosablanca TaxID=2290929 RepID=UPI002F356CF8
MPVTFGELSTLTTPLSVARFCALLFSCLTFSLAASASFISKLNKPYTDLYTFCMVIWCLFFILTFLVMLIHFIQFHNLLPLSWKNLTATVAALATLMTFSTSITFSWILYSASNLDVPESKSIAAAVGSFLTVLAYIAEVYLIRRQTDAQLRGYMATLPGLLKVLQVCGGCVALVMLSVQNEVPWRVCVSAVTYGVCLLPSSGTVLVMLMDCAARSPVPFDRLLAVFTLLGVIMYIVGTVVSFTQALKPQNKEMYVVISETVMACITLLAYTVDLAFSIKLLCDRK